MWLVWVQVYASRKVNRVVSVDISIPRNVVDALLVQVPKPSLSMGVHSLEPVKFGIDSVAAAGATQYGRFLALVNHSPRASGYGLFACFSAFQVAILVGISLGNKTVLQVGLYLLFQIRLL